MGTSLRIDGDSLVLELTGIHAALALGSGARVPLADVTGVRVAAWDEVRTDLGWRTFGGYVPGLLATGWYAFRDPDRAGQRQFWAVFRERGELVVVDTALEKPARVVAAVAEPHAVAASIEAARRAG